MTFYRHGHLFVPSISLFVKVCQVIKLIIVMKMSCKYYLSGCRSRSGTMSQSLKLIKFWAYVLNYLITAYVPTNDTLHTYVYQQPFEFGPHLWWNMYSHLPSATDMPFPAYAQNYTVHVVVSETTVVATTYCQHMYTSPPFTVSYRSFPISLIFLGF